MIAVETDQVKRRLAQNVRRLMDARGWSARELARRCGESHVTVTRLINAQHVVGIDVAERVASALDTTIDYLLRAPEEIPEPVA